MNTSDRHDIGSQASVDDPQRIASAHGFGTICSRLCESATGDETYWMNDSDAIDNAITESLHSESRSHDTKSNLTNRIDTKIKLLNTSESDGIHSVLDESDVSITSDNGVQLAKNWPEDNDDVIDTLVLDDGIDKSNASRTMRRAPKRNSDAENVETLESRNQPMDS